MHLVKHLVIYAIIKPIIKSSLGSILKILKSTFIGLASLLFPLFAGENKARDVIEVSSYYNMARDTTNELLRTDPLFRHHFYGLMRMRYGTGMIGIWSIKKIRQEALGYAELDRLRNNGKPSRRWIPTPTSGVPQTVRIEYERRFNPLTKEVEWALVEYPLMGKFKTPKIYFE